VRTRKLQFACPVCASSQVFYTCTTDCCYNHVCADCGATFEPVTTPAGGALASVAPPDPPSESTDPTAPCAKCHAAAVCIAEDGRLVCWKCRALLTLEMDEIHPG
jgi:hypothetical protein